MPPGLWRTAAPQCGVSGCDKLLQLVQTLHRICIHPRPLRQSGNQGTAGSCNRCHGESRDPSSTSGSSSFVSYPTSIQASLNSAVHSNRPPPVFNASRIRRRSLTVHRSRSFSNSQACPASFKGGVTTLENRPSGHVGWRWILPVPGTSALPRTRHCQVVFGGRAP